MSHRQGNSGIHRGKAASVFFRALTIVISGTAFSLTGHPAAGQESVSSSPGSLVNERTNIDLVQPSADKKSSLQGASPNYSASDGKSTSADATSAQRQIDARLNECFAAGTKAMQNKSYGEAITKFQECTRLAPTVSSYWWHLGTAHQSTIKLDCAAECYTKARTLSTNPDEEKKIDQYLKDHIWCRWWCR